MNFVTELFAFLKRRKKIWLWPIILILAFIGIILAVGASTGLSAFIYPLF